MTIPFEDLAAPLAGERKPTWRTSWRAWPSWSYVSGWGWPYRFWKHHGGRSFIAPYPCHSTLVVVGVVGVVDVGGRWWTLVRWGFSLVVGRLGVGWSGGLFSKQKSKKNAGCGSGWMKMTGKDDEDWFLFIGSWIFVTRRARFDDEKRGHSIFVHYPSANPNFEKNWVE